MIGFRTNGLPTPYWRELLILFFFLSLLSPAIIAFQLQRPQIQRSSFTTMMMSSTNNPMVSNAHTDDEWHPHDPAHTTPQLLEGLWFQIAQGKDMVKGVRHHAFAAWIVCLNHSSSCLFADGLCN